MQLPQKMYALFHKFKKLFSPVVVKKKNMRMTRMLMINFPMCPTKARFQLIVHYVQRLTELNRGGIHKQISLKLNARFEHTI